MGGSPGVRCGVLTPSATEWRELCGEGSSMAQNLNELVAASLPEMHSHKDYSRCCHLVTLPRVTRGRG